MHIHRRRGDTRTRNRKRAAKRLFTAALFGASGCCAYAAASTIVYQCGSSVCAIDPDAPGAVARTLKTNATAAGITADGLTVAWVVSNPLRIEKAPLAGGAAQTLYSGEIYDYPRISPSGRQASWTWYYAGFGWYTYVVANAGGNATSIASSTNQTSQGWLGELPIVGRRGGSSTRATICHELSGGPACDELVADDPSLQIGFPSGSIDGHWVVAVRAAAPSSLGIPVKGALGLYSASTHAWVRDLTPGADDAFPVMSPDGSRVAFERSGQIWTVAVAAGSTPHLLTAGTMPFWGGGGDAIFRDGFD